MGRPPLSERARRRVQAPGIALALAASVAGPAAADDPDLSGVWMPAPELAEGLSADDAPFTDAGRAAFAAFDSQTKDSAAFCMPLGTPRNMLATAPEPLEILQRPEQLTMLIGPLNDVRRVFLDGRAPSPTHFADWSGESMGHWDGGTLVVETNGMTEQSILNASGLPHTEEMTVTERLRAFERDGARMLEDVLVIDDPATYAQPLQATRYFRAAPQTPPSEGSTPCLIDQWRRELERQARSAFQDLRAREAAGEGDAP